MNRTRSTDSSGACAVDGKTAGSPQQASPPERLSHVRRLSDDRRLSHDPGLAHDRLIESIAARQHGAVSRSQLLDIGIPGHAIDYRVKTRRLHPLHRGVYRVGPLSPAFQRIAAALLACGEGAVLSHRSAAELWWQPAKHGRWSIPAAHDPVDISVPRHRSVQRVAVRIHRVTIDPDEITRLRGFAITTPARTMLDLAAELGQRELEQAFARMLRTRCASSSEVNRLLERYPARSGAPRLRALLDAGSAPALTRSEAEERLLALVLRARLPRPRTNARVAGYEADLLWPAQRLVVEVDGYAFHASRDAFEADRLRDAAFAAAGFRVMRVTWRHLTDEPETVVARLAQALVSRR